MNRFPRILGTETQKYAFWGALFGFLFPSLGTLVRIVNSSLPLNLPSILSVQSSDSLLWIIDTAPLFLGLFAALAGRRQENLLRLNMELRQKESELEAVRVNLLQRVEERTAELSESAKQIQRRAEQFEIIANVARSAATAQSLADLLTAITREVSQRFGFYHVGIFLLDENREYATLIASNSEGGRTLLEGGHRLKVGEQGLVGYVTLKGQPRIAFDVGEDAAFFNNPELTETHSEVALPLKFGQEIIGAMDIQSTENRAFTQDDLEILTVLADQVSVAIQNTRSLEQAQRALNEAEAATGQLTGQAWKGYADALRPQGYRYDGIRSEPWQPTERAEDHESYYIPIQLRGQTIGRLKLKSSDNQRSWTEDERAIIASTAERLALALEGARLLDEAQKRAAREAFLSEVGTRLGASFQLDSILRDTVEELGQSLKGSTVSFQLINPSAPPSAESGKSGNGGSAPGQKAD